MYLDTVSFGKSLKTYTEPLIRTVRDLVHDIPGAFTEFKRSTSESWTNCKPKTLGGALLLAVFACYILMMLPIALVWSAFVSLEDSDEPGWLIIGLFFGLYVLSVPVAVLWLTVFNIKFGLPDYPQSWVCPYE